MIRRTESLATRVSDRFRLFLFIRWTANPALCQYLLCSRLHPLYQLLGKRPRALDSIDDARSAGLSSGYVIRTHPRFDGVVLPVLRPPQPFQSALQEQLAYPVQRLGLPQSYGCRPSV